MINGCCALLIASRRIERSKSCLCPDWERKQFASCPKFIDLFASSDDWLRTSSFPAGSSFQSHRAPPQTIINAECNIWHSLTRRKMILRIKYRRNPRMFHEALKWNKTFDGAIKRNLSESLHCRKYFIDTILLSAVGFYGDNSCDVLIPSIGFRKLIVMNKTWNFTSIERRQQRREGRRKIRCSCSSEPQTIQLNRCCSIHKADYPIHRWINKRIIARAFSGAELIIGEIEFTWKLFVGLLSKNFSINE